MDRYKKLITNTLLFGLATFSSKILTFVMMPILTRQFGRADYSTIDLIVGMCNFLVPLISVCVHEAVIRFGLDKSVKKSDVFTTALLTIFAGYALLILCYPLLGLITRVNSYLLLIYLYVLTSAMRSTVTHFVRASGFVRVFALDGLLTTVLTVVFTLLFVIRFGWGIEGYVCGTILADFLSSAWMILALRLHRFFRPRRFDRGVLRAMLRYSAPLMPTAIFWWITNLSDRFLVDFISGPEVNGLYAVSYKIPTMITLVSTIFTQAWQISAFSEENEWERARFYSNVFTGYRTLIFVAASGLILLIKPITRILVAEEYYLSWRYVPFLVMAVAFSCLVTFLGTIYNVAKHNRMVTVTTLIGAAVNLGLNLLLIPKWAATGAALATFISYLVVFVIRAVDSRRYIALRIQPLRMAVGVALLLLQVWVCLSEVKNWPALEVGILLLLVLLNLGPILYILKNLRRQLNRRRAGLS